MEVYSLGFYKEEVDDCIAERVEPNELMKVLKS